VGRHSDTWLSSQLARPDRANPAVGPANEQRQCLTKCIYTSKTTIQASLIIVNGAVRQGQFADYGV